MKNEKGSLLGQKVPAHPQNLQKKNTKTETCVVYRHRCLRWYFVLYIKCRAQFLSLLLPSFQVNKSHKMYSQRTSENIQTCRQSCSVRRTRRGCTTTNGHVTAWMGWSAPRPAGGLSPDVPKRVRAHPNSTSLDKHGPANSPVT